MDTHLDDFKTRMAEFIETLQIAEDRPYDAIVGDLIDIYTPQLNDDEIPFERKVMSQLSQLLKKSIVAASLGDARYFEEAVKQGMSSNFCDALADIVEGSEASEVKFDFSWSSVRPTPQNVDTSIVVRKDVAGVLKEASNYLRTSLHIKKV